MDCQEPRRERTSAGVFPMINRGQFLTELYVTPDRKLILPAGTQKPFITNNISNLLERRFLSSTRQDSEGLARIL